MSTTPIVNREWVGNLGYLGMTPEATIGTAVTPDDWTLLYDETLTTNYQLQDETPIYGQPFATYQTLPGQRTHKGDITIAAEPNTATYLFDAMLTRGTVTSTYTFTVTSANATQGATYTNNGVTYTVVSTISSGTTLVCTGSGAPSTSGTLTKATGTGDATITFSAATDGVNVWPFTLTSAITNSYTIDISTGFYVKRFYGCMINKITPSFDKNEMRLKAAVSALGSFIGAPLASTPTGSNPYTVTFSTTYTSTPTAGLVVGDLIRFYHSGGTNYTDATVASIVNGTQITTTTNVTSFNSGDFMFLRPATPSFNLENIFLWTNTTFQFGSNLSGAASATQLRVEEGSMWELENDFEKDGGSNRSGSADPASLVRTTGKASLTVKKFFGLTDDVQKYELLTAQACIITHTSATGYSLQVEFPQMVADNPLPGLASDKVSYSNIKFHPDYNSSSNGGYLVNITNQLATIS